MSSNITVRKLLINLSARTIDNNVDTTLTTEVEKLSLGHASRYETLILNPPISNSMNVFPETIHEGHASRHETDNISVGYAPRQDPFISNESVPNVMNMLPGTVSYGQALRHGILRPRTNIRLKENLEEIRTCG